MPLSPEINAYEAGYREQMSQYRNQTANQSGYSNPYSRNYPSSEHRSPSVASGFHQTTQSNNPSERRYSPTYQNSHTPSYSAHKTYPKAHRSAIYIEPMFLRQNPSSETMLDLFKSMPDVVFFAKDRESRFVAANEAMLETKNLREPGMLLNKTDYDFFPPALAGIHLDEDRHVMQSGEPLNDQIWFTFDHGGAPQWFSSSKMPYRNSTGEIIGVIGVRHRLESEESLRRQFRQLFSSIRHLVTHFTEPVSMHHLAGLAGMSIDSFSREFSEVIGMGVEQFLQAYRMEKARFALACTSRASHDIARESGFHDEHQFKR